MKRISSLLIAFIFLFSCLFSCKKTEYLFGKKNPNELPDFSSVDFSEIFTPEDSDVANKDEIEKTLQKFYDTKWVQGDLSGGFLIAKGNEILFEKYRGFAQPNNQEPIGENTALHLASISKTMTAMVTLKMVEDGRLKLDQKINQILPKFPYPDVRVIDLLSQRSGLPKYEYFLEDLNVNRDYYMTNQKILEIMIAKKPAQDRPANTHFTYCNTNFMLLALVIEKVCKTPFPQVMNDVLFVPLKMKNTYIFTKNKLNVFSKSFFRTNKPHPLDYLDLVYGDKNVYSTPRDMLQFSKALYSPHFLRKNLLDLVFKAYSNESKGVNNYGLGFRMKVFNDHSKLTYHNGWWHGSNTVFVHLLNSKTTIIALGNKYGRGYYSALGLSSLFEDFPIELDLDEGSPSHLTKDSFVETNELRINPSKLKEFNQRNDSVREENTFSSNKKKIKKYFPTDDHVKNNEQKSSKKTEIPIEMIQPKKTENDEL